MSDTEMREWAEFYSLEPWGFEVEWYRFGTVAAMVGNAAPNRRKGSKSFSPGDFVPKVRATTAPKPQEASRLLRAEIMAVFGDRVKQATKHGP